MGTFIDTYVNHLIFIVLCFIAGILISNSLMKHGFSGSWEWFVFALIIGIISMAIVFLFTLL